MKKFIYTLIIILLSISIYAQNQISGKITDSRTNNAIEGANIYLLEQHKGTVTNIKGEYKLRNLPNGKLKIQFSFIGYKTVIKTIQLNNSDIISDIKIEPTIIQSQEIVVSGGTYSSQHENAIKIETINGVQINNIGTPSFNEAIATIPGVDVISKGSGVSKLVIRGLSMTNILLLNNGVKMENFQFSENHPFIVDEFGIDKVEIIKGPASLLYGSDAIGGVINFIKEKPAPIGKIIGDYNLQYYSNTEGIVTNLGIKGTSKDFFWGVRAGVKNHADYIEGNSVYVPNTRFNELSLKTNIGLNTKFGTFKLYYDYNKPKLGMCVGAAVPLISERGRENDVWYQDLTNHVISLQNKLYIGNYKIDVDIAYQMNNRKLQTDTTKPAFEMVDMDLNTLSYEIKTYLPSSKKSEYIIGFQGMNQTNRNNEAPAHIIPDADVNEFSFFGLIQYTFFDKLRPQAGIRYDYRSVLTQEEPAKPMVDKNYNNISASIGATYNLNEQLLFRVNFASAYRTPNIAELTQNGMHGTRYEQGNANLKPQRSYEADLSMHYHSNYATFDISGFYNQINNYIFIAPTTDTTGNGDKIYRYSQTNAELLGAEAGLNVYFLNWLNVNANYSYIIGKKKDGGYLPFIPQNKLRLEIKAQKEKLGFLHNSFVKIGTLIASKQSNSAMFETKTDGYILLNAGIGGEIKWSNQMVSLGIYVNNLLDETYYDHLSTLKGMKYYNIGRNISVILKIPFDIK